VAFNANKLMKIGQLVQRLSWRYTDIHRQHVDPIIVLYFLKKGMQAVSIITTRVYPKAGEYRHAGPLPQTVDI
jgi:hypothetical protein